MTYRQWKKTIGALLLFWLLPLNGNSMVFPGASWQTSSPEKQQVDPVKLDAALNTLKKYCGSQGINETVVVRNGYLIWGGSNINRKHNIWSITKSFTSTALGLLIAEGKCKLNTLAKEHEPLLEEYYSKVTLRHFANMTSGYDAVNSPRGMDRFGNRGEDWSMDPYHPAKPLSEPGSAFLYWDEAMMMNGRVLTSIADTSLKAYLQSRLMEPIGITSEEWSWETEGRLEGIPINNGCTGITMSASNLARYGHLFLNQGRWKDQQIVSAEWVRQAASSQVPSNTKKGRYNSCHGPGIYGYNWWVNGIKRNGRRNLPHAPLGTFYASGHNHNVCFVIPEWRMVIARTGTDGNPPEGKEVVWNIVLKKMQKALMDITPSN